MAVLTIEPKVEVFNIAFENPADADLSFKSDPMHFPAPLSPLFQSVMKDSFSRGMTSAIKSLGVPLEEVRVTFQENYFFDAFIPVTPVNEQEARDFGARAEATMQAILPRQLELWQTVYLPRIKANNARIAEIDFGRASFEHIGGLLDEVLAIVEENWEIHFKIVMPMMLAMQVYDELYADLFGGTEQDAHELLVGLDTASVRAGIGLSELAGAAKATGLDRFLLATPADEVMDRLPNEPMGEYYAAAVRDYLREYGLRQDLFEFSTPTWQEDPTIAITSIQSYLRSGHDARAQHEAAVRSANSALSAARHKLAGYPEAVRMQFEAIIDAAKAAHFLQEEHNFYIDQQSLALGRFTFLKFGRRLVRAGVLTRADDIFMLRVEDLRKIAKSAFSEDQICDVRILVLEREASLERSARLVPPAFVGLPPAGPPPSSGPMDRAVMRFFGGPPQKADSTNQIKGNAGSRGCARGKARVARTLDEAKHLQPGEVLVTITTMPAWTPLFGVAAALVTETGGPLSHGAIVAREYGLPAVVGAYGATRAIKTGDVVFVDGTSGVVTIESR